MSDLKEDEKPFSLWGSVTEVPKVRTKDDLDKITLEEAPPKIDLNATLEDEPIESSKSKHFDYSNMVDSEGLIADLQRSTNRMKTGQIEEAEYVEEGEEGEDEELDFLAILLDDPQEVVGMIETARKTGHAIAYRHFIERPLDYAGLKKLRKKLSFERNRTDTQQDLLESVTDYLEKVDQIGSDYLKSVNYSAVHKKVLTKFVENKIAKLKLQGKKINPNVGFAVFMITAEAKLIGKLYEIGKSIPKFPAYNV